MKRCTKPAALAALLLFTCAREGTLPHGQNVQVVLISIDTLRSDHLPAYGYTKIETPGIDSLRADSILYEHAYSHCPLTLVSHASISRLRQRARWPIFVVI